MSSPRVRRRGISRLYSAEDEVLDKVVQEAEARLVARRQARAEAREFRMRELEKQREADQHSDQYDDGPAEPIRPPRGVKSDTKEVRSSSFAALSLSSSLRNSEENLDNIGSKEYKLLMNEVSELEEKFRKAMVNTAQLDNEKTSLSYEVDTFKDELEEIEEQYLLLQKDYKSISRAHEFLDRDFKDLQNENSLLKECIRQRDELITEHGLVLVGGEPIEEESEEEDSDEDDVNSTSDKNSSKVPKKEKAPPQISKFELVSQESAETLKKAGSGSLDARLKKLAEEKQEMLDEIYRLRLDYEEEKQKLHKMEKLSLMHSGMNGPEMQLMEIQREANKQVSDYKYKLKKAEQEITTLQSSVSRLEGQVSRFKGLADAAEATEDELKAEKRKLLRELREAQSRIEELETANVHLQKRIDKLKTVKNALLKS